MATQKQTVVHLLEILDKTPLLRKADEKTVAEYVKLRNEGIKFPPIVMGIIPFVDGKETKFKQWIIDGVHRLLTAQIVKDESMDVDVRRFESEAAAAAEMLNLNLGRGLQVDPKDRDKRIKILKETYKLKNKEIAKLIQMSEASVSRILSGQQAADTSKVPASSQGDKEVKPFTAAQMLTALKKISKGLKDDDTRQEYIAKFLDEIAKNKKETFDLLNHLEVSFSAIHNHIVDNNLDVEKEKK